MHVPKYRRPPRAVAPSELGGAATPAGSNGNDNPDSEYDDHKCSAPKKKNRKN